MKIQNIKESATTFIQNNFPPISWETVGKAAKVVGIILIAVALCPIPGVMGASASFSQAEYSLEGEELPAGIVPYFDPSYTQYSFHNSDVVPVFPEQLPEFLHPGIRTGNGGKNLCYLPEDYCPESTCDETASTLETILSSEQPAEHAYWMSNAEAFAYKGVEIASTFPGQYRRATINHNPQKLTNFRDAHAYVQKTVLSAPSFFEEKEPAEILDVLCETHKRMTEGLGHLLHPTSPGKLRDQDIMVFDDQTEIDYAKMRHKFMKTKPKRFQIRQFNQLVKKLRKWNLPIQRAVNLFLPKEFEIIKKIYPMPTLGKDVATEFSQFAKDFKRIALQTQRREIDPFGAAAWTHMRMVRVHPFDDANGRMARLFTNVILKLGGKEAVIYRNDDEYTSAIIADIEEPGVFARYLKEISAHEYQPPANCYQ